MGTLFDLLLGQILALFFKLRQAEKGQKVIVTAMPVHQDNFLDSVTGNFIARILQDIPDELRAVSDCSRLVFCFQYLAEIVFRED